MPADHSSNSPAFPHHPDAPVQRWLRPLAEFLKIEAASGGVLLACTILALVFANSPWAADLTTFWSTHLFIGIGALKLDESLLHWINDALMTIFFFVVGLEIKRELVIGELRDPRKAALPAAAALGGMVVPALIYSAAVHLLLPDPAPARSGWGISMATDIAFVVGFLALLGSRVPFGLKIMLLSLAIADDLGAVLVIACFYTHEVALGFLALAAIGFGVVYFLNRIGVRTIPVYVVVGSLIWLAVLESGVHPTVAGVLLGLLTPASAWIGDRTLREVLSGAVGFLSLEGESERGHGWHRTLDRLAWTAREGVSPLARLEHALHPWVAFAIMPVFALANAGVAIDPSGLGNPIAVAVAAGLVLGKPIGIFTFSWLAVRLGLGRLPTGVSWKVLFGGGCLAGIGFTMSLFIAGLALKDDWLTAGKVGTLAGSLLSAIIGCAVLLVVLRKPHAPSKAGSNA
jgi:NhaA family Na+:H+ antiporter